MAWKTSAKKTYVLYVYQDIALKFNDIHLKIENFLPLLPFDFWNLLPHVVGQIAPSQKVSRDIMLLFQPQYRP